MTTSDEIVDGDGVEALVAMTTSDEGVDDDGVEALVTMTTSDDGVDGVGVEVPVVFFLVWHLRCLHLQIFNISFGVEFPVAVDTSDEGVGTVGVEVSVAAESSEGLVDVVRGGKSFIFWGWHPHLNLISVG